MADKAWTFGKTTFIFKLTTGFGFYIETIPHQMRPALVADDEDPELMLTTFIDYTATAIKLPFLTLEIGRYQWLTDEFFMDFGDDNDDDNAV